MDCGESLLQDRSHVRRRLHGDHVDADLEEPTREAARARREVDHSRTGAEATALGDPGDRVRGVLGPELVVVERVDDLEAEAFRHDSDGIGARSPDDEVVGAVGLISSRRQRPGSLCPFARSLSETLTLAPQAEVDDAPRRKMKHVRQPGREAPDAVE
jgi:hypothetical protein